MNARTSCGSWSLVAGLVLALATGAQASIVTQDLTSVGGLSSGWSATYDNAQGDIVVDQVNLGQGFLLL